jgi:hypothetical protein
MDEMKKKKHLALHVLSLAMNSVISAVEESFETQYARFHITETVDKKIMHWIKVTNHYKY